MRFRDAPAAVTDLVVVSYNSLGFGVNAEGQIVPGAFGTPTAGAATRSARVVLNTPALTVMLAPKTLNPTAVTQAIAANTARDVAAITQSVQNSPPVPGPASAAAPPAPADLGSQAVAASAPVPLIAAPSGTDYSWLYWAGGGVAILGLGYAILKKRKKATP
jgi:LPXTG-motif cell wall-anchored protein